MFRRLVLSAFHPRKTVVIMVNANVFLKICSYISFHLKYLKKAHFKTFIILYCIYIYFGGNQSTSGAAAKLFQGILGYSGLSFSAYNHANFYVRHTCYKKKNRFNLCIHNT